MGHKHSKTEILEGALATAFADGLSQLTFGRVARRLGISDRIVVYYFPTKNDLIGEVIFAVGIELQQTLGQAFTTRAKDHLDLVRTAWPIFTDPESKAETDAVFALFFEANGLAVSGREPYRTLVPALVEGWISWASEFVDGPAEGRQAEAEAAIALIDGLLLLRQLAGADAAERAAHRLGVL